MHRAQFARDAGGDHFLKRLLFVAKLTFNWVDSGVSEGRVLAGCCLLLHGQDEDIPQSGATRLAGHCSLGFAVGR